MYKTREVLKTSQVLIFQKQNFKTLQFLVFNSDASSKSYEVIDIYK
jgi:hypothetical protein